MMLNTPMPPVFHRIAEGEFPFVIFDPISNALIADTKMESRLASMSRLAFAESTGSSATSHSRARYRARRSLERFRPVLGIERFRRVFVEDDLPQFRVRLQRVVIDPAFRKNGQQRPRFFRQRATTARRDVAMIEFHFDSLCAHTVIRLQRDAGVKRRQSIEVLIQLALKAGENIRLLLQLHERPQFAPLTVRGDCLKRKVVICK